jgi:hypothetical protein
MDDLAAFRTRLALAGATIAEDLLPFVHAMFGPLIDATGALATMDLADLEPFAPARRLVDDAVE